MSKVTFIIFGATGDLCKRKLIPALYRLVAHQKIPQFLIVGAAREASSAQEIINAATPFIEKVDPAILAQLQERFIYQQTDVTNYSDIEKLTATVTALEQKHQMSGSRIIYCATASAFFCGITGALAKSGLARKMPAHHTPFYRIVYEKPFGSDLISAKTINDCITEHFAEHQIYRIDHYLLKEFVSNIALVRFTNCVFEPLWNHQYIDAVQIILSETIGIGSRSYYDNYGAVADVMQNHILEILALLTMEAPERLTGNFIRNERAKVLEKVQAIDALYGQYTGYHNEPHVAPRSTTETFAIALLRIHNPRWAGVPFYVKTGKSLQKRHTVIHIKFKQVECRLAHHCPSESNSLTIEITPESIMSLRLNIKKPGLSSEVMPVNMTLSHDHLAGAITPEAYELLFEEIMRGEESVSIRLDEIESSWRIIEQLRALKPPLYPYEKASSGPAQATEWARNHGMRWFS